MAFLKDQLAAELMRWSEVALDCEVEKEEGTQGHGARDHEHDHDLILYCDEGRCTGEDLPGHHAGKLDDPDRQHGVDRRDHGRAEG